MNHSYEIAAIGERLEYLQACLHIATFERADRKCWVAPPASLSRELTEGSDIFTIARALDRSPAGPRGAFKGDTLEDVASIEGAIEILQQRLRELRS